ncbi:uncharacterized protein CLUP02_05489, partial [Colletotrichum lupini]
ALGRSLTLSPSDGYIRSTGHTTLHSPSSHWSDSQRTTMARALFAPHGNVRMLLLLLLLPLTPGSACNCVRNQQHPSLHPPFQLVFHFSTAKLYFPRTSHEPPAIPSSIRVGNDSSRLPHHTIGGDDAYGCLMLVKVAFTSGISVEKTYAECSALVHLEDSKIASALTHLALIARYFTACTVPAFCAMVLASGLQSTDSDTNSSRLTALAQDSHWNPVHAYAPFREAPRPTTGSLQHRQGIAWF